MALAVPWFVFVVLLAMRSESIRLSLGSVCGFCLEVSV